VIFVCTSITNVNQLIMCLYYVYWNESLLFFHFVCSCEVSQTFVFTIRSSFLVLHVCKQLSAQYRTVVGVSFLTIYVGLAGLRLLWNGLCYNVIMKTCHFAVLSWKLPGKTARWGNCMPWLSRRTPTALNYTYYTKGTSEIPSPIGS